MPSRQMNVSNTQKRIWDEAIELQLINVQMHLNPGEWKRPHWQETEEGSGPAPK